MEGKQIFNRLVKIKRDKMKEKTICLKCKAKTELIQDDKYPNLYHCKLCGWNHHKLNLSPTKKTKPITNKGFIGSINKKIIKMDAREIAAISFFLIFAILIGSVLKMLINNFINSSLLSWVATIILLIVFGYIFYLKKESRKRQSGKGGKKK